MSRPEHQGPPEFVEQRMNFMLLTARSFIMKLKLQNILTSTNPKVEYI